MQKIIIIAFLIALTACVQKPITDYDASRDFMSLHHYAWTQVAPTPDADPLANNTLNDQRVHQAVDDILSGQGMQKVDATKADFLIAYRLVTREKINSSSSGLGLGIFGGSGGFGIGGSVAITQYQETELFIDMLDPKSSALIWRGSAKYSTQTSSKPEERMENIRKYVTLILSAYPPK